MKEYFKNETVTYNLISFTGFKALLLYAYLMDSPKSYDEICEHFLANKHLKEKISIDTLRVYITSLKRVGCEVKRERIDGVSKYSIISHPFELDFDKDQLQAIIKAYKNITKNMTISELISLEKFFKKLSHYVKNEDFLNIYRKNSAFKDLNLNLIEELLDCCDKKNQIVMIYNSPNSGRKEIEIITDKLEFSNNKLYLYGTGFEYMQYGSFLASRIVEIKEIRKVKTIPIDIKQITVGYEFNTKNNDIQLEENEKIIQTNKDNIIVEITSSNEFLIRQRLLSFGPDCKILYPESFREDFVSRLKSMKAGYIVG